MDKILSALIDESVTQRLNMLSNSLRATQKAISEGAIKEYAEQVESLSHARCHPHEGLAKKSRPSAGRLFS